MIALAQELEERVTSAVSMFGNGGTGVPHF